MASRIFEAACITYPGIWTLLSRGSLTHKAYKQVEKHDIKKLDPFTLLSFGSLSFSGKSSRDRFSQTQYF